MTEAGRVIECAAPAKINLALHVTGQRFDGYHLIETLAVFARHGDTIRVGPADADRFEIGGRFGAGPPADGSNLVVKAREALRRATGRDLPPVAIQLEKALPVASGVGGGSSDAAAALKALNDYWELALEAPELALIGAEIGADLPMCLAARPLLASGVGEAIHPLDSFPALALVLVNSGVQVATGDVFTRLARKEHFGLPQTGEIANLASLLDWLEETRNDLEPPACEIAPAILETIEALRRSGAAFARMSGSGASCFGLYPGDAEAKAAAAAITRERPDWLVVATTSPGAGEAK
ncbi:MAG: 4-(cytidine 5'-diphospho)-2-C-methyl-D-erythritol kinase [Rhizobiaceae bacterium]|nr:4-(cytidine 5'-diphospho)-2-C-methyl-D-erythritol kinase [Rhizobiaceae bacterium]MCV0406187.1 4-(cytidine 5'-diphospho)-2-C-methyl-D-erythritol kinase [Rhizobiaceae bacterium]